MILTIQDWIFDVDITETMYYSATVLKDHCQCGYCRNFYSSVDTVYPQLRPFLAQFGMNVETPEELMPFEPTVCTASYCICGSVLQAGSAPIDTGETILSIENEEPGRFNTICPSPYFVLSTGFLELPWVLPEDPDEVLSPANEPEFLEKMWNTLLNKSGDESIQS